MSYSIKSFKKYIFPFIFILCVISKSTSAQPSVIENDIKYTGLNNATLVGANGLIMKTKDGGLTWVEAYVPITHELKGEDFYDSFNGVVVGESGTVLVTNDAGNIWALKTSGTLNNLNAVKSVEPIVWVACGDNGTIIRSIDGGETWDSVYSNTTSNLNDIDFVDGFNGYIVGSNSVLLKTTDGGASWNRIYLSIGNKMLNAIDMRSTVVGTIVGNTGLILNTADGGITWSAPFNTPSNSDIFDIKILSDTSYIASGADGLIIKSIDGGLSWEIKEVSGISPTNDLKRVNFENVNTGISVGEEGTEIYTIDGGDTWSTSPPAFGPCSVNNQTISIKNYPNPFNPSTTITYSIPFNSKVTIKVYDITGREVITLADGFETEGEHSVIFNASNLSSGVYIYRLTAENDGWNDYTLIRKMILNK